MVFNENLPVGCLLIQGFSYSIFVKPSHRKQGLATKLFTETASVYDLSKKLHNAEISVPAIARLTEKFNLANTFQEMGSRSRVTIFKTPIKEESSYAPDHSQPWVLPQ